MRIVWLPWVSVYWTALIGHTCHWLMVVMMLIMSAALESAVYASILHSFVRPSHASVFRSSTCSLNRATPPG
jgi:hypothetical protein